MLGLTLSPSLGRLPRTKFDCLLTTSCSSKCAPDSLFSERMNTSVLDNVECLLFKMPLYYLLFHAQRTEHGGDLILSYDHSYLLLLPAFQHLIGAESFCCDFHFAIFYLAKISANWINQVFSQIHIHIYMTGSSFVLKSGKMSSNRFHPGSKLLLFLLNLTSQAILRFHEPTWLFSFLCASWILEQKHPLRCVS